MNRQALIFLGLLASCQQSNTNAVAETEQKQLEAPVRDVETLPPDETAVIDTGNGTNVIATASTKIPERLHGRWGMVANDCDPSRADAKGLMTVSSDTLRFYESRATVAKVSSADPDRFAGAFSFSGEGQQWRADIILTRTGDTLTRAEGEQRFTYKRCA